jgi:hypothetical protein
LEELKRFLSDIEVSWQELHRTKARLQWLPVQDNMKNNQKGVNGHFLLISVQNNINYKT